MSRDAARRGGTGVVSLILAMVLGTALGWSIRPYLEPSDTGAIGSSRPTPSSLTAAVSDPATPTASPLATPVRVATGASPPSVAKVR